MPHKSINKWNPWDTTGDELRDLLLLNAYDQVTDLTIGLPDPVNGEIHVSGGYLIAGNTDIGENKIILDGDTEFISHNPGQDILLYLGTEAAINGNGYAFTSFFTTYVAPAGKVFDMVGTADKMFSMLYCGISSQAQKSTIRDFGDLVSFKMCYVLDGAGLEFGGACGKVSFFITPFKNMTGVEITTLADFDGLLVLSNNFFKDLGGEYVEIIDLTNVRARILDNDFPDATVQNFVGFSEESPEVDAQDNTNQANSGVFLDAGFTGNATAQTVGTSWVDIDTDFVVEYGQRLEWDAATKSFYYPVPREERLKILFNLYAESPDPNQTFEFAIFRKDDGAGSFSLITNIFPYLFRLADDTKLISLTDRIPVPPLSRFKLRMRKPSGSSNILITDAKIVV